MGVLIRTLGPLVDVNWREKKEKYKDKDVRFEILNW